MKTKKVSIIRISRKKKRELRKAIERKNLSSLIKERKDGKVVCSLYELLRQNGLPADIDSKKIEFMEEAKKEFEKLNLKQRIAILKKLANMKKIPWSIYNNLLWKNRKLETNLTSFYDVYELSVDEEGFKIIYIKTADTIKVIAIKRKTNIIILS